MIWILSGGREKAEAKALQQNPKGKGGGRFISVWEQPQFAGELGHRLFLVSLPLA